MRKKLAVISLGCDKNRVDTEGLLYNLSNSMFSITDDYEEAQIILINTCAFIESARKEAIETILKAAELKAGRLEKLVVAGCLPEKYYEEIKKDLPEVDLFLKLGDYNEVEGKIYALYGCDTPKATRTLNESKRLLTTPDLYAYLKIADGCDNHCTFCTIPSIRGNYKSKPIEEIIREANSLNKVYGVRELILVAQDVTSYGRDLYGKYRLLDLVRELSKLDIELIRLLYCYPDLITRELIEEISSNPKLAKYIDIPIQHVDDEILRRMNRKSTYNSLCALMEMIREIDSSIAIRTTVMVGFPSETKEAFERLYSFLDKYKLEHVGMFAYSKEADTPSALIKEQVTKSEKLARLERLGGLYLAQVEERNKGYIGRKVRAQYMDIDYERNMFVARSPFNAPEVDGVIYFTAKSVVEFGQHYDITIKSYDGFDMIGELEE